MNGSEVILRPPHRSRWLATFPMALTWPVLIPLLVTGGLCAAGLFSVRYAWWRPCVDWNNPRVLMYHMVSPSRRGTRFNKLRVAPASFAQQLHWLQQNGFTFVFASQLFTQNTLPERAVCLTFDDGYEDNLTAADPLLAQYGARATLYLVTERDQGWSSKKKAHHSDDELAAEPKLTDEQVSQMVASGRWELGGHTRTHANLPQLPLEEARQEIAESRVEFPRRYQTEPATFAYPFGIYRSEHAELVGETGFQGAVTTEPGIAARPYSAPFEVPRIKVSGKDSLLDFRLRMRTGKRGVFQ